MQASAPRLVHAAVMLPVVAEGQQHADAAQRRLHRGGAAHEAPAGRLRHFPGPTKNAAGRTTAARQRGGGGGARGRVARLMDDKVQPGEGVFVVHAGSALQRAPLLGAVAEGPGAQHREAQRRRVIQRLQHLAAALGVRGAQHEVKRVEADEVERLAAALGTGTRAGAVAGCHHELRAGALHERGHRARQRARRRRRRRRRVGGGGDGGAVGGATVADCESV
jgi:hypothetical protein